VLRSCGHGNEHSDCKKLMELETAAAVSVQWSGRHCRVTRCSLTVFI